MHYLFRPIKHLYPIREWALERGAQMRISPETYEMSLQLGDRKVVLFPRFVTEEQGRIVYQRDMSADGNFIGWMPYVVKSWSLSNDKRNFKDYAVANGLRVTANWTEGPPLAPDYIVKPAVGSFGEGIRGPFGPLAPLAPTVALAEGEFFEQFIRGRSAKAWFWNGRPVALEVLSPPMIAGDGRRSLREIAAQPRGNFDVALNLDDSVQILAWQGVDLDTVLPAGTEVMLDYRYMTPYDRVTVANRNVWHSVAPEIAGQFSYAGQLLYRGIDAAVQRNSVFTLDAVIDAEDRVWLLEMNSHPMIHPSVYPPMLASVFDDEPQADTQLALEAMDPSAWPVQAV